MSEEEIGQVFKFFAKPSVAAIKLSGDLKIGDKIRFTGATTDFTMSVESMQIERDTITEASAGQDVGIKVPERVRPNDKVYKILE
ncbi:MAG: translation elongation factor-like protein [Promethearchaeota archaeon]